jgi:hypothetical protein
VKSRRRRRRRRISRAARLASGASRTTISTGPAPYTPTTAFGSVFSNAFPGKNLGQIVQANGGGLNALGRHTVAALLNAASPEVEYGMTPDQVIAAFNAAYASGNYEAQKNVFEGYNERGCTVDKN